MASVTTRQNGHRWIQFLDPNGERQTLRLGKATRKVALSVCGNVEELLAAKIAGATHEYTTALWRQLA